MEIGRIFHSEKEGVLIDFVNDADILASAIASDYAKRITNEKVIIHKERLKEFFVNSWDEGIKDFKAFVSRIKAMGLIINKDNRYFYLDKEILLKLIQEESPEDIFKKKALEKLSSSNI